MKKQAGFTLIELIVVIVVLGILAATALPRFIDFKDDAANAAVQGVAGGIASASAVNYAGKALGKPGINPTTLSGTAAAVCDSGSTALGGVLASGWPTTSSAGAYIVAPAAASPANCSAGNGSVLCTVAIDKNGNSTVDVGTDYTATASVTCY